MANLKKEIRKRLKMHWQATSNMQSRRTEKIAIWLVLLKQKKEL